MNMTLPTLRYMVAVFTGADVPISTLLLSHRIVRLAYGAAGTHPIKLFQTL